VQSFLDGQLCMGAKSPRPFLRFALVLGLLGLLAGGIMLLGKRCAISGERIQNETRQEPVQMSDNHNQHATKLAPYGDMQLWYYNRQREFRYPIPTDFDFAYINRDGEPIITGPIAFAESVVGGVGVVRLGEYKPVNGKFEFVDEEHGWGQSAIAFPDGNLLFVYGSRLRTPFFDDLAATNLEQQKPGVERIGLVDKNGHQVSGNDWKSAGEYSEGLMPVRDPSGLEYMQHLANWGFQDKNGIRRSA